MHLIDNFASRVFTPEAMKEYLPEDCRKELAACTEEGRALNPELAPAIAEGMMHWAVERGATHYTHWFQPMTGVTAEKHEAFLEPRNGKPALRFSADALIQEEPDASSFPSGGLRTTFEARGYTVWDPSSYAFLKGNTLCIPTAFCSYGGEALDMKTPLLRSIDAINRQSLRVLRALGDGSTKRVIPMAGAEQEYFLIDEAVYERRPDLLNCRRTLVGNAPAKGQELNDHYFAAPKPRIQAFMAELDEELWKLGIYAKTEHNEVAPNQFELAPFYSALNLAADQNQLVMEMMQLIAPRHGLRCVLHEKPFRGLNGSGKHVNWSLSTNEGINLLEPGETPGKNLKFMTFLVAILRAVDNHADLMRYAIAGAGNDHRLGGHEAPPAIISCVLGADLESLIRAFLAGEDAKDVSRALLSIGAAVLPGLSQDMSDRNRTSPFAFTGNKFEFRMPGAKQSVALPGIILSTIVADSLREIADRLEKLPQKDGVDEKAVYDCLRELLTGHERLLFSGNNYTEDWVREAEGRGLPNFPSTADLIPYLEREENYALFERMKVFTRVEWHSRALICSERYGLSLRVEAKTLIKMLQRGILPALFSYQKELCDDIAAKKHLGGFGCKLSSLPEETLLAELSENTEKLWQLYEKLPQTLAEAESIEDPIVGSRFHRDELLGLMNAIREISDCLEAHIPRGAWPYPGYSVMLLSKI